MVPSALEGLQKSSSATRVMATVRLAQVAVSIGHWHDRVNALAGFVLLACQRRGLDAAPVDVLMNLDDVLVAVLML